MNFILAAQNPRDGGWRYNPKDPGDTSRIGLAVDGLEKPPHGGTECRRDGLLPSSSKWLIRSPCGGTEYCYQPGVGSSPTMTSVGLLGRQYLGTKETIRCSAAA